MKSKLKIIFTYNNSIIEQTYYRNKIATSSIDERNINLIKNKKVFKSETSKKKSGQEMPLYLLNMVKSTQNRQLTN